jgi:hypothetical protein
MGREQKQRKRKRKLLGWRIRCESMFNNFIRKVKCKETCFNCEDIDCSKHPINYPTNGD